MAEAPRRLPDPFPGPPGLGTALQRLRGRLRRWGRQLCWSLFLLLYAGWPRCLTPPLPYRPLFGMLYPAYASFKAVKTKNTREHVRWMMYWIVFSLFMTTENFTDLFISWFPFYYEVKMAFLVWLLSPYTEGASLLYRRCVHPMLASKEEDIDKFLAQVRERSCQTMLTFGKRGLSLAATTAIQAATTAIQTAITRQGVLAGHLRSFSMEDLRPRCRTWLCLEEQELLGHGSGRCYESKTDSEESWSESSVFFSPSPLQEPKDQSRSQSLRNNVGKEGSSRLLRSHTRRKVAVSEQDS